MILALALGAAVLAGRAIGALYQPQPLAPTAGEVSRTGHFVVILGNSLTDADIDPDALERALDRPEAPVEVRSYSGGAWDALHYYMLALLNRGPLRPERDLVLVEASPFSTDDDVGLESSRLGAIRPEVALPVIAVPGLPTEHRLDIALGALAPLYRYRVSLRGLVMEPRLQALAGALAARLAPLGLVGEPRRRKAFEVVTVTGRNFAIEEIRGDLSAFQAVYREELEHKLPRLRVGGYRQRALRRAVEILRAAGLSVYLLETPTSRWLAQRLAATEAGPRHLEAMQDLARSTGAVLLRQWPEELSDEALFWDHKHLRPEGSRRFTEELATRLRGALDRKGPPAGH